MMNYLSVENLTKSFGIKELFTQLSFGIEKGQKVALVARNGAGKSTLMRILTGKETADSGNVIFNKEVRIGYLSQEQEWEEEKSILENIFSSDNKMTRAIEKYQKALVNGEGLQHAHDEMENTGAWMYEVVVRQVLGGLDIHDLNQMMSQLSGGQKRRIALAKVLIDQPDLVFLDEPTNHLDLDMIEWLEEYLLQSNMTIFMVTHDRYFLENITDEILELENQNIYRYKGNFSYYLEKKAEREALEKVVRDRRENLFRRELEWARKMPRARSVKSKSRMDGFYTLKETLSHRKDDAQLELEINISRLGSKIVEMHKVKKSFGDTMVLNGFDYVFKTGEKIGIVGKNGVGKTSFLNLITGKIKPDNGKVQVGDTVVFGYYSQSGLNFKEGKRLIETVRDVADYIPLIKGKTISAAQMLERFMFPRNTHFNYVESLSGGEKKRLQLLLVLMKNPNFLILDEPTNDLDIFSLAALEDYLLNYPGCLMIVSHDRYFMDKLVDHIMILDGRGTVKDIVGSYASYRAQQESIDQEGKPKTDSISGDIKKGEDVSSTSSAVNTDEPATKKISFKEKFEFEQLDKEIPQLETAKKQLEEKLVQAANDHLELVRITDQLGSLMQQLDHKTLRWLELSEKR